MVCMSLSTGSISLGARYSMDGVTFVRQVSPGDRCISSATK